MPIHRITPVDLLFPVKMGSYNKILKRVEAILGTDFGFTPHSPRAGFATDGVIGGVPFAELQEQGRWVSPPSLRRYIDIITASSVDQRAEALGLVKAPEFAYQHIL